MGWTLLGRVLGRGSRVPLVKHAQAVEEAAEELGKQLRAWLRGEEVDADVVSQAERRADDIKRELRANVNELWFTPVPKAALLELIWHQDEIADLCQDAALLMRLRRPDLSIELEDGFRTLGEALVRVVHEYQLAVEAFEEALKSGMPREKVNKVQEGVERINLLEHESDLVERELVEEIYRVDGVSDFDRYHLVQLVLMLGGIVDQSENAAGDLRLLVTRP